MKNIKNQITFSLSLFIATVYVTQAFQPPAPGLPDQQEVRIDKGIAMFLIIGIVLGIYLIRKSNRSKKQQ